MDAKTTVCSQPSNPMSCSAGLFANDQRHRKMKTKEKADGWRKTKLDRGSRKSNKKVPKKREDAKKCKNVNPAQHIQGET